MNIKLILLIDDEEDIIILARSCLELQPGWKMISASNGREGIILAEAKQPDAILLDAIMPKLDGMQTLKKLQSNARTNHIPVIFITDKAEASDRYRFYKAGAKGVINKPFQTLTLASQISGFLGW